MAITNDGSFDDHWTGGSSHGSSTNWGTTKTNDVYIASITLVSPDSTVCSITSITDTESNTWHKIDAVSRTDFTQDITGGPVAAALEVWYAVSASSPSSGTTITFNTNRAIDGANVVVMRVGGLNTTQPVDANGSLPAHASQASSSGTTPSISSLSVNTADTAIFALQAGIGNSGSDSTSPHQIAGQFSDFSDTPNVFGTNAARSTFAEKTFSSQQTNFTADGGSSANNWLMIVTALTADAQSPAGGLAAVETPDTFYAIGYPGFPGSHGSLATTEAPDIFSGVGNSAAVGTLVTTEAPDIFSAFMRQPLTGVLVTTEAPDVFHGTGIGRGEDGVLAATEGPDTFHGTGIVPAVGVLHAIEAPDRFRALGAGAHRVRRRHALSVT